MIKLPPAYVASDGSMPNKNQSATATKKTLNLLGISTRTRTRRVRNTHTETMEAKTGLVHVTSARSAVMETGSFVSVWTMAPKRCEIYLSLQKRTA